jgi:hypothetical protein
MVGDDTLNAIQNAAADNSLATRQIAMLRHIAVVWRLVDMSMTVLIVVFCRVRTWVSMMFLFLLIAHVTVPVLGRIWLLLSSGIQQKEKGFLEIKTSLYFTKKINSRIFFARSRDPFLFSEIAANIKEIKFQDTFISCTIRSILKNDSLFLFTFQCQVTYTNTETIQNSKLPRKRLTKAS